MQQVRNCATYITLDRTQKYTECALTKYLSSNLI